MWTRRNTTSKASATATAASAATKAKNGLTPVGMPARRLSTSLTRSCPGIIALNVGSCTGGCAGNGRGVYGGTEYVCAAWPGWGAYACCGCGYACGCGCACGWGCACACGYGWAACGGGCALCGSPYGACAERIAAEGPTYEAGPWYGCAPCGCGGGCEPYAFPAGTGSGLRATDRTTPGCRCLACAWVPSVQHDVLSAAVPGLAARMPFLENRRNVVFRRRRAALRRQDPGRTCTRSASDGPVTDSG